VQKITQRAENSPVERAGALPLALLLSALAACAEAEGRAELHWSRPMVVADPDQAFEVPPPPLSEGSFPCSDCHDPDMLPANPVRRQLRVAHQDIELRHDEQHRWCLDCHDAEDRDQLHLASGELVPFEQSYRLCGQCHGDKYRDWRAGVHGRRTGSWNGEKTYLLCVACHDSHQPAFKPLRPMPAPTRPVRTP